MAQTYEATVRAVYVVNTGALPSPDIDFRVEFIETEDIGQEAVGVVAKGAEDAGIDVRTAVIHGTPYEEILTYAEDITIDSIRSGPKSSRPTRTLMI